MNKSALKTTVTALVTLGFFALGYSTPAFASSDKESVTLSAPTASDVEFNAIATWNLKTQSACLYSSTELKVPSSADAPWVSPNSCYRWTPPAGTSSGIYVASWDSGRSKALLVISAEPISEKRNRVVVLVPDYTWQAYDLVKNGNFYFESVGQKTADFSTRKLNLLRPMNFGIVGDPVNYPSSPALYPSANPIAFLRSHLENVDVVSESTFDESAYQLADYQTIVLYGHDEYWSAKLKSEIERAVAGGTSLMNLSGNTGYRKLVREADVIGFDPPSQGHAATSRWGDSNGDTTALKLLGVTYLGEPFGKRQVVQTHVSLRTFRAIKADGLPKEVTGRNIHQLLGGMLARDANSALFDGTGIKTGDFFGYDSKIMSIELDGIPESSNGSAETGFLTKFGSSQVSIGADAWVNARQGNSGREWRVGQLIESTYGQGKVFSAGPIGWNYAIARGDHVIEKITLNAFKYLGQEVLG